MKISTLLTLVFFLFLTTPGCSNQNPTQNEHQTTEINDNQEQSIIHNATGSNSVLPSPIHPTSEAAPEMIILDIPLIKQNPELKYGCEVTSLAMVLNHAGIETNKLTLADELPKDEDPVQKTKSGDITNWGNPDHGFVGDITGKSAGYAVYAGPLEILMKKYLQDRSVNLTRKPFEEVLAQIKKGKPVILWTTGDYKLPDRWESWTHGNEQINTPLDLHAVVLVGYDKDHLYINDPLTGKKAQITKKDSFLESWTALGQQALSYN
jgi:uncharacterized protein YvpB